MWFSKSPEQKRHAIEDELSGDKAELETLVTGFSGATEISSYYLDKILRLRRNIAMLESKLNRMN